jgi:3',5'-cyclic AMP phosphodiesterase CpdA
LLVVLLVLTWLAGSVALARPVAAASDPVVAAAGDIACDPSNSRFNGGQGVGTTCRQLDVSNLLVGANLAAVLALGDTQYNCGGYSAFMQSYDLSWGRVKSITHPVVGNHEYLTSGGTGCTSENANAAGYFEYFGAAAGAQAQGYYSFNIGAWHLIALNSNCTQAGGCSAKSPQGKWLAADLAANQNVCTLAFWHIPLFSSGGRASASTRPLWQLLYNSHADLILDGHDHIYERFAPQTPTGVADPVNGIRQITVGTGGANHTPIATPAANSVVADTTTFGILKLTLHASSYSWNFVPAVGTFKDGGSAACHA